MAVPTGFTFGDCVLLVSNNDSPETFSAFCGLNSRSINESKTFSETTLIDCADEDAPAVTVRTQRSSDWSVSGQGVLSDEALTHIENFYSDTVSRNLKFIIYDPALVARVTKTGKGFLSVKNYDASKDEPLATVSLEIVADGALTTVVV